MAEIIRYSFLTPSRQERQALPASIFFPLRALRLCVIISFSLKANLKFLYVDKNSSANGHRFPRYTS